ncbi:MAG TPA: GTPase [Planctomycetaceae bacterium]|nr:GTPase [Planctomycetaceae bacterium]
MAADRPRAGDAPIAALLTPRGRGAVATIGFAGDAGRIDRARPPLFRAANGRPLAKQEIGRVIFGRWGEEPPEEVVVCRVDETIVEINCHGGDAAARRILRQLEAAGSAVVPANEFLVLTQDPLAAELADAVGRATTLRTATILLEQSSGRLRDELLALLAAADDPPRTREDRRTEFHSVRTSEDVALARGRSGTPSCGVLRERLDALLAWTRFGMHLTRPWSVVLAGRPNVGKSSLINALVGYARSIVFDQPGTTRDVVTAETAFEGWPVRLTDTAGLRSGADPLESAGIERAREQLAGADCRVLLIDTSGRPGESDRRLLAEWPEALVVAHKSDLPDAWGDAVPPGAIGVSSLTGAGVGELTAAIVRRLVPAVPEAGTAIPVTERQMRLLRAARRELVAGDYEAFCRRVAGCLSGAEE